MNNALKLVVSIALLAAIAGLGVFLWLRPADSSLALEPEKPAQKALEAPGNAAVESQDKLADEAANSERASMPKEAKNAPAAAAPAVKVEEATIVARFLDENLRPVADAWLRLPSNFTDEKIDPLQEARSGNDGVATLHWKGLILRYAVSFQAGASGYATLFPRGTLKAGETLQLGDLTLRPGGSISGRVLDLQQRPVAKAEVAAYDEHSFFGNNDIEELRSRGPQLWEGAPQSKSGDDGRFLLEGVPAGMTRAWAHSEGMRWSISEPIEVPAGSELRDVVLVLDPEDKNEKALQDIEGVVLDPEEKPVARASLNVHQTLEGSSWSGGSNADEGGRFRVHPQQRGVHISIDFGDPDERYTGIKLEDVKPGTKNLVIRLEEARKLVLAARDEHGPVESYRVRWCSPEWSTHGYVDRDEPHKDGRANLRAPTRSGFWLQVMAPGHKPGKLGPIEGERVPAELGITLVSIPGIRGRVVAGEKPVPGAKVALLLQPANMEIQMNGFTTLVEPDVKIQTTSDSEGRFSLDLSSDGNYVVFADAEGYARTQFGPAELAASKGVQDLVLALDAGGVLEGKVLTPPGHSPAGVVVGINRGDARPFTQVAGADGSFRFEHLTPGAWEIQRCESMFEGPTSTSMNSGDDTKPGEIRRDFVIATGQTTHHDLDLRDKQPCTLEIVLTNNSQPARAWTIVAWPKGKHTIDGSPPGASTDSSGHARLSLDEPGGYSLTIKPPPDAQSAFNLHLELDAQPGTQPWTRDVQTGRVEGSVSGWRAEDGVVWRLRSESSPFEQELRIDEQGHFADTFVGAGKVLVLRGKDTHTGTPDETLQSFDLAPGATKSLQLP